MMVDMQVVEAELAKVASELGHPTDWYLTKALLLMKRQALANPAALLDFQLRRRRDGTDQEASGSGVSDAG